MAVEALIRLGEYKLAFRLMVMQFRIQKLQKAKEKHNRKQKKLLKRATELHNEIAIAQFKDEVEFFATK